MTEQQTARQYTTEDIIEALKKHDDVYLNKTLEKAAAFDGLVARLHQTCSHPDYEYDSKEYPRKFSWTVDPPEGFGWVENNYRDGGRTRYDNTEDYHFMRLKSDAEKDPVSPWELKPVALPPLTKEQLLDMVREVTCKGYMRSSSSHVEFNSKPEYVSNIAGFLSGTYYYHFDGGCGVNIPPKLDRPLPDNFFDPNAIYCGIEIPGIQILINLNTDMVILSIENKGKVWSNWHVWSNGTGYHLDTNRIKAEIEKL